MPKGKAVQIDTIMEEMIRRGAQIFLDTCVTPPESREEEPLSKEVLYEAAIMMTGGTPWLNLSIPQLRRLMTITQFVTDLCLNEIEARGELTVHPDGGLPIVPYMSDHFGETVLTRSSES